VQITTATSRLLLLRSINERIDAASTGSQGLMFSLTLQG